MKMVKCLPEFEYFYCILENRNFIFKIRISKVADYAALIVIPIYFHNVCRKGVKSQVKPSRLAFAIKPGYKFMRWVTLSF